MGRVLEYVLDLAVALMVGRVLSSALRQVVRGSIFPEGSAGTRGAGSQTVRGQTARDPVCGMFVSTELSHRLTRDGKTLHFCSRECRGIYEKQHSPRAAV